MNVSTSWRRVGGIKLRVQVLGRVGVRRVKVLRQVKAFEDMGGTGRRRRGD